MLETPWDFANRRMLVRDGGLDEDRITLTTVRDFANVVKRAVEYEGVWPVQGGMVGETVSVARLVELGEELRGVYYLFTFLTLSRDKELLTVF
jgi:hypothetical protein